MTGKWNINFFCVCVCKVATFQSSAVLFYLSFRKKIYLRSYFIMKLKESIGEQSREITKCTNNV